MSQGRIFSLVFFTIKTLLLPFIIVTSASAQTQIEQMALNNQVQMLLKNNAEMLEPLVVKDVSNKILENQQHYSNDIIAKVFLLSANVASNLGDINQVHHYAQLGLKFNSRDKKIKLLLLLKLAEVYVLRKKYEQLLVLMQAAVNNSEFSRNIKYQLFLLSYRSVAFAMVGKHQQALSDLKQVERGINESELKDHIQLLTILAQAYHHLGDYQTSLTMQQKILKLRFDSDDKGNLDKTYLYLGYAYLYLTRFDDAYNAFWESKKHAENKVAIVSASSAYKGLGIVLLSQKKYSSSIDSLKHAINIFSENNMQADHVESVVALAKAKLAIQETVEGYALLHKAIKLLDGKDISLDFTGFYRMVSEMYFAQKNYQRAYLWRERYSQVLLAKFRENKKSSGIVQRLSHLPLEQLSNIESIEESRNLAVQLAQRSELSSSFVIKFQKQRSIIISLAALVSILLITLLGLCLRLRSQKMSLAYEEENKPSHSMAGPMKTKFDYQLAFKKSRKFQYPLTVAYLVVENWQELVFHFNKKSINEVTKDIASLINEQLTEFDSAGLLNQGEYLLAFEHRSTEEARVKLDKLLQAINSRSFANLGDFSIIVKYSVNTADFKDIDPYLFLARIAESVSIVKVNQTKVI